MKLRVAPNRGIFEEQPYSCKRGRKRKKTAFTFFIRHNISHLEGEEIGVFFRKRGIPWREGARETVKPKERLSA